MSCESFKAEALRLSRAKPERLDELAEALSGPGMSAAGAFVRQTARGLCESTWTALPADLTRLSKCFGSEQAERELTNAKFTIGEAVALSVFRAVEDRAEAFGEADDMAAVKAELATLQERFAELLIEIESAITAEDMEIDYKGVSDRERDDGLAKVTIRGIPLTKNWPERLVSSAA